MSPLLAPWIVWLIYSLNCAAESSLGTSAASKSYRNYRKTCGKIVYDIHEAVCCKNQLHQGEGLSCCGELAFNPANASCCNGHITPGLSHKVSDCCGPQAFNPLNEICCQSTVMAKPAPKAKCCGKEAVDEDKQLCCGIRPNQMSMMRISTHHLCCGTDQYDTRTHCCCMMNGSLHIQCIHSTCCVKDSEADKRLHCNTTVQTKKSSHHICCVDEQYDTRTHCCCMMNGSLHIQHIHSTCCVKDSEADKQLRCNTTVQTKKSSHHICCGDEQYDTRTHCCCHSGKQTLLIQPINSNCCPKEGVGPQYWKKPERHINGLYPSSQPSCTEPRTSVCGSSCYNPTESACCERNQRKSPWCCSSGRCDVGPKVYIPSKFICCDGCLSVREPWMDQCCGQTPYGLAQVGVLCCNNTLYKDREDGEECSETGIRYNAAKGTMCIFQFHATPGQHCCGTETYTPNNQICCNGYRHPKEENSHCCGIKVFNIKDQHMKCCGDTLYNLKSLGKHRHEAQCCGSVLQGPQDVCCSSDSMELLYAKKTEFICCGDRYVNTSLWSCCGGKLSPVRQPGQLTGYESVQRRVCTPGYYKQNPYLYH